MSEPPLLGPAPGPDPASAGASPPDESIAPEPPDSVDAVGPVEPASAPPPPEWTTPSPAAAPDPASPTEPVAAPMPWTTRSAPSVGPPVTARAASNRSALVAVSAVVIVIVGAGVLAWQIATGLGGSPTPPVPGAAASQASIPVRPSAVASTPSPTPEPSNAGSVVVFSDDFSDPGSGWATDTMPSGTSLEYTDHGYVVVARGVLRHMASAPYDQALERMTASVTATQSTPAPLGAGFGVTCDRGSGGAEVRYEFTVETGKKWFIERRRGPLTADGDAPVVLKRGTSASSPGSDPMTIEGTCITQTDGLSTRLRLVIDGQQVADLTDTGVPLPGGGWLTELVVSSQDTPSTVTVTHFEVRSEP